MGLSELPADITRQLVCWLGQTDALSLARTCKALAAPCLQRLHDTVVVDSCYTAFSKEYAPHQTYVNRSYSFRKLLSCKHKHLIRAVVVVSLPDSGMYEQYDVDAFLRGLVGLRQLVWHADFFRAADLESLPARAALVRLEMNQLAGPQALGRLRVNLDRLQVLEIRHYHRQARLRQMLARLLAHNGGASLRKLRLSRFASTTCSLLPPASVLATLSAASVHSLDSEHAAVELDTVPALLYGADARPAFHFCSLCELSLGSILVCASDARLLCRQVPVAQLRRLELVNVAEYADAPRAPARFLDVLAPELASLEHLHLDYREARRDTVAAFLAAVPPLRSLDLVCRMNSHKAAPADEPRLFAAYSAALARHTRLTKLSLEVRHELLICEQVTPTPLVLVKAVAYLSSLRSLRLTCVGAANTSHMLHCLANLYNLQLFDVFGVRAGGPPNLGMGTVHPSVYDEWFKVEPFASEYYSAQPNLRYLRINRCVFECGGGELQPRDMIERWFDEHVRV